MKREILTIDLPSFTTELDIFLELLHILGWYFVFTFQLKISIIIVLAEITNECSPFLGRNWNYNPLFAVIISE